MRGILTYHSIDDSGSPISIDEACFRRHVAWLASNTIRVVPLGEILSVPDSEHAVAITFDDGFASLASIAWPLLRDRGLPATLFVVPECVGGTNRWGGREEPGIPTLSLAGWDELTKMAEEGLNLAAHSMTHPHLETLDDTAIVLEIVGPIGYLEEQTGRRPTAFCYPYGTFDERCVASVSESYDLACTTELNVLRSNGAPHLLPRLDAFYYQTPGRLESFGSAGFRAHLALRRAARGARRLLG